MVKEVFHMDNSLPEDLLFVPFESSLTVHVSHVEAPVTGEVNAQRKFNFTKQQPFRPCVNPQFFNRAMQGNVQEQEKTGQPW